MKAPLLLIFLALQLSSCSKNEENSAEVDSASYGLAACIQENASRHARESLEKAIDSLVNNTCNFQLEKLKSLLFLKFGATEGMNRFRIMEVVLKKQALDSVVRWR